jgi:hypothetical protein
VVLGGNRRPTTGAGRSTVREAQGDTNLPAKGPHLYRVEAELKLLVLRLFVSLIYRPITNPANIRSGIKDPKSGAVEIVVVVIKCAINNAPRSTTEGRSGRARRRHPSQSRTSS